MYNVQELDNEVEVDDFWKIDEAELRSESPEPKPQALPPP
jgi:hypothetical protein